MIAAPLLAAERPAVTVPRQTSGDTAVQPKWEEGLRVTVGLKDADIVGSDQRAIQAAVSAIHAWHEWHSVKGGDRKFQERAERSECGGTHCSRCWWAGRAAKALGLLPGG